MHDPPITHKMDDGFLLHNVQRLCVGVFASIAGGFAARGLIPLAYAERGYSAIGGEWLFVFVISLLVFQGGNWLFEKNK